MLTPAPATWIVRGATFALWALAAGSAVLWGLRLAGGAPPVSAPAGAPRQVAPVDPLAIARLLGSSPAAVEQAPVVALASRFQLLGVAAGARSGGGAAIISVDGKPARPFRVGAMLDEGYVLQSVQGRKAVVAAQRTGEPVLTLELPVVTQLGGVRVAPGALPPLPQSPVLPPPIAPGRPPGTLPAPPGAAPQAPTAAPR